MSWPHTTDSAIIHQALDEHSKETFELFPHLTYLGAGFNQASGRNTIEIGFSSSTHSDNELKDLQDQYHGSLLFGAEVHITRREGMGL